MDIILHNNSKPKSTGYRHRNKRVLLENQFPSENNIFTNTEKHYQTMNLTNHNYNQINLYSITNKYSTTRLNKYLTHKNKSQRTLNNNHNIIFKKIKPNNLNISFDESIDSNEELQLICHLNKGIEELSNGNFVINVNKLFPQNNYTKNRKINQFNKKLTSDNKKKICSSTTNITINYNSSSFPIQCMSNTISSFNHQKIKITGIPYSKHVTLKKHDLNNTNKKNKTNINYTFNFPNQKEKYKDISPINKKQNNINLECWNNNTVENKISKKIINFKTQIPLSQTNKNQNTDYNSTKNINKPKNNITSHKKQNIFYLNKIFKINQQ